MARQNKNLNSNQVQSSFGKLKSAYWLIAALAVVLAGLLSTIYASKNEASFLRQSLIGRAETIAAAVDTGDLKNISGTEADLKTDGYQSIKSELIRIRKANIDSRFVYLMGFRENQLFFFADSEDPASSEYSPPGQVYTEASQQKINNSRLGTGFAEGPYEDRWGTWVSGYAPVVDPDTKKVLATAGIDISDAAWKKQILYAEALPASVTLFILFILWLLYRFRKRQAAFVGTIQSEAQEIETQEHRLKGLYEITTRPDLSLPEQIRAALKTAMVNLNSKLAIVSRIEGEKFTILYCVTPPNTVKEGDVFELKETYCDITVKKNEVLAIDHMAQSSYKAHACYGKFHLESYIGVPVMVAGKLYGTLNFSSPDPHNPKFNESDSDFVRLLGKWVSAAVEHELLFEKAQEVDRMKSEFVSLASHQLRTPLTGIRWFTDLLLRDKAGALAPTQKDYIQQISDSNMRLIKLVEDMLNVSHIETGNKFNLQLKQTDVATILISLKTDLVALADQYKVSVNLEKLPKQLVLNIDGEKIREVFQNLMSNAVKYSKEGGVVEVGIKNNDPSTSSEPSGNNDNTATIYVKDSGLGIPKSQQNRIFEKFFRADNVQSKETEGTGLGMYIAKAIAEKHGGKLWFESEENVGSIFFVSLPKK